MPIKLLIFWLKIDKICFIYILKVKRERKENERQQKKYRTKKKKGRE